MRKNSSKLILAVIGALLICGLSVFFGSTLKADLKLDEEYGNGYQLVYQCADIDLNAVKETAEILESRLKGFGASSVVSSSEGNVITVKVTGISAEQIEQIRKDLVITGEITIRNSDNELLMKGSDVLKKGAMLSVMRDTNDTVYYVLNVEDTTAFYQATATLSLKTNKIMVVWEDYKEGQDYTAEAAKSAPAYLGAAAVSSGIRESCYLASAKSYEDSVRFAVIANGGTLPTAITETSFTEIQPKSSLGSALMTIIGPLLVAGGFLIFRYGISGIVTLIMLAGYSVAFFKMNQLSNVIFNSSLIAVFAASVALGLLLITAAYEKSRRELLKGRNAAASYQSGFSAVNISSWEGAIIEIIAGGIGVLLLKDANRQMAIAVALGGVCNLIFMVIWNRAMLSDLIDSNYFGKSAFSIQEAALPDVVKGESYQETSSASPLRMLITNDICCYIFLAAAAAGIIKAFTSDDVNSALMCILTGAIAVILAGCYGYFRYRRNSAAAIALAGCAVTLTALPVTGLLGQPDGQILVGCSVALAVALLTLNELKTAFRPISREKLNQEKLDKVADTALNNLTLAGCVALVGSLSGLRIAAIALTVLALVGGVAVSGNIWLRLTRKNGDRRPSGKKNNKKELKERTIFGLNEVK